MQTKFPHKIVKSIARIPPPTKGNNRVYLSILTSHPVGPCAQSIFAEIFLFCIGMAVIAHTIFIKLNKRHRFWQHTFCATAQLLDRRWINFKFSVVVRVDCNHTSRRRFNRPNIHPYSLLRMLLGNFNRLHHKWENLCVHVVFQINNNTCICF